MATTDPIMLARNRLAGLHNRPVLDHEAITEARRNLTYAKVERSVKEALAAEPAMTADQRAALVALLVDGAR